MGTGVGEAMLISAVTGAGTSAVMGGDPLKGALLGAVTGGMGNAAGAALGGQAATQAATQAGTQAATQAGTQAATQAAGQTAASVPSAFQSAVGTALPRPELAMTSQAGNLGPTKAAAASGQMVAPTVPQTSFTDIFKSTPGGPELGQRLGNYIVQNPRQAAMISGGLGSMMNPPEFKGPVRKKYDGPLSRFSYDPSRYRPSMAGGGLADSMVAKRYMKGGHLGSYSDGGRLLKGPGDGMSDDIPAQIGRKQPARLADGEFVVPADVVSGLGNGSTDAGARKLYAMMDKVRSARTGSKKQGREIKAEKYLPT